MKGRQILPGFVDIGCAFGEPGREQAETIATGLSAAARGGYTVVALDPGTEPPIASDAEVRQLLHRAEGGLCRLLPVAAAMHETDKLAEMDLLQASGAVAVSLGDALPKSTTLLRSVLEYAAQLGFAVHVHPSDPWLLHEGMVHEGTQAERMGLAGVPDVAEEIGLGVLLPLVRITGCRVHLMRLSTAKGVAIVRAARAAGLSLTADVSFRHLLYTDADIAGYVVDHKLSPPLRGPSDREALWAGLQDGTIDAISSGHRPVAPEEKEREFDRSPPGAIGLELVFPLLWSRRGQGSVPAFEIDQILTWLVHGPRRVLGLGVPEESGREGTVWDFDATWTVGAATLRSLSRNCPELGLELAPRAVAAIRDGREIALG